MVLVPQVIEIFKMAKVSIIIRCLNRLEYTIKTISSIDKMAGMDDYEMIVIDQGSTDGTVEWLKSLDKEGYYKLRYQLNSVNSGDAGGMKEGYNLSSDDCKYIMQFDNDCEAITENFLKNIVDVMDDDDNVGCIMLKREGVRIQIRPNNVRMINNQQYGDIRSAVCCSIIRKDILDNSNLWYDKEKIGWLKDITSKNNNKYKILKSLDNKVFHIDTTKGQSKKYPSYIKNKVRTGTNYVVYR